MGREARKMGSEAFLVAARYRGCILSNGDLTQAARFLEFRSRVGSKSLDLDKI